MLDISHKSYPIPLSRDPKSTPAEESQRALNKFNLVGKGASHCSFQQGELDPAGSQSLFYSTLPIYPLKWVLNSQSPSKGPLYGRYSRLVETPRQSSVWCQDGPLKASAAARSLDWTRGHGHTQRQREKLRKSRSGQRCPPALPPAPFFLRPAPDQMSNKNSAKKSRDGTTSISPSAEPPWTPRAFPSSSQPALRPHPAPGPLCPPPRRGLPPRGHPGAPGGLAQAPGPARLGPAQSGRPVCRGCRSRSSPWRPRRAGGGGYPYLSGLFPGLVSAQLQEPMSVPGARPLSPEGGRGSRGGGWGAGTTLAPSHAPRPAPGRGRTAPPPAPAHRLTPALTHTHTPSRALTHALPSLLLLCLSPPAVWGPRRSPAPRLRHAVSAPAPRFAASGCATEAAPGRF